MIKINRLEIENVKRVRAVQIEPSASGLTVIGGRNGQGKTSVLDAILWALGGNKHKPSEPARRDSSADPMIRIQLSNGLTVIRDGKNSSLKVIDEHGGKSGQALLDSLISELAIDLPSFLHASVREKAETLLKVIGVGDELARLDREADQVYQERHLVGQSLLRKRKHAEDLPFEQGVPDEEISASELIREQQEILARNGANQKLRARREELGSMVRQISAEVDSLRGKLRDAESKLNIAKQELSLASRSAADLQDESTSELERSLQEIDDINRRVRINATKRAAEDEAADLSAHVDELTAKLESVRSQRLQLLAGARLPLSGLSIEDGELTYMGQKWDCMSSADQLRVGVAIARQINPGCGFVLLDKLEQMDVETLRQFGEWLDQEGLQAIATRVSTGGECAIVIEDGLVAGAEPPRAVQAPVAAALPEFGFAGDGF